MKPRVAYLDIDDTLLVWTDKYPGVPAPRAAEFLMWLHEHFEIRWLTMWCPMGVLTEEHAHELSVKFNYRLDASFFSSIKNPKSFEQYKTDAIDFTDPRPWVWIEDAILGNEILVLDKHLSYNKFYKTNVSHNIVMLQKTWRMLGKNFNLLTPDYLTEYSREMIQNPDIEEQYNKILSKFTRP